MIKSEQQTLGEKPPAADTVSQIPVKAEDITTDGDGTARPEPAEIAAHIKLLAKTRTNLASVLGSGLQVLDELAAAHDKQLLQAAAAACINRATRALSELKRDREGIAQAVKAAEVCAHIAKSEPLPEDFWEQQGPAKRVRRLLGPSVLTTDAFEAFRHSSAADWVPQPDTPPLPGGDFHAGEAEGEGRDGALLQGALQRLRGIEGVAVGLAAGDGKPGEARAETSCPPAEARQVWLECRGVLRAEIALEAPGRPQPMRVAVYGAQEEPGPSGSRGAWGQSEHELFRRISGLAMRALSHFCREAHQAAESPEDQGQAASQDPADVAGQQALERLLLWLAAYRSLFRQPCAATGRLLAADPATSHMLPPLLRPWRRRLGALVAAALDPEAAGEAYHPQEAPVELL